MPEYSATVAWERRSDRFIDNRYSRVHRWLFDGGVIVPASASPHAVRAPFADPACVDPEEAYVAALSSCHMLWFLSLAAAKRLCVDSYRDDVRGTMEQDEHGTSWMQKVTLRPHVVFISSEPISDADVSALHHAAHASCYIANSVRSEVVTRGSFEVRDPAEARKASD